MSLIQWNDQYKTGSPAVDHEHRKLIDLINELHAQLKTRDHKDVVIEFLGEIYAKIAAHFALEEQQMLDVDYDQYGQHKADHEKLLDEIRDIMDDYEDGKGDDVDDVLSERLSTWFGVHFRTFDARLHHSRGQ